MNRLLDGADFIQVPDLSEIDDPLMRIGFQAGGIRTYLSVPLRNNDRLLGRIVAGRQQVRPFTDKQVALLQNFAAQAVIAMENARLLGELRQRTEEVAALVEFTCANRIAFLPLKIGFGRLLYDYGLPWIKIVCQQIRGCLPCQIAFTKRAFA